MGSRQRKYGKSSEEIWEVVRGNMGSRQRKYGKSSEEIWEVVRGNMGSRQRKYGKSSEEICKCLMSFLPFGQTQRRNSKRARPVT